MNVVCRIALNLFVVSAAGLAAAWLSGCHSLHPDDQAAVYKALGQQELSSVEVSEDRASGVITLRGIVGSQDNKQKAEQLTEQAAPGYKVQNQLTVDSTGIMSMADPNAKVPGVQELAHPPASDGNPAPPPAAKNHR